MIFLNKVKAKNTKLSFFLIMIIIYVAYTTSEIDADAITVSKANHGKTIC